MPTLDLLTFILLGAIVAFFLGKRKAYHWQLTQGGMQLHSLPSYYGYMVALWSTIPALIVFSVWSIAQTHVVDQLLIANHLALSQLNLSQLGLVLNEIHSLAINLEKVDSTQANYALASQYASYQSYGLWLKTLASVGIAVLGFMITYLMITPSTKARNKVENLSIIALFTCALIAVLTTVGIVFSVLFESIQFFSQVPVLDFLLGTHWSPQIAIREDQVGGSGAFGAVPIFFGTIFISFIAMVIAAPLGLISAIYLAEYASRQTRNIIKPILEVLAGIPTVVYGFFAALTIGPLVKDFGESIRAMGINLDIELFANITVSTESALAAGLVMGMMIVPFILSLSDDVISAVPDSMRDGSTAMGATKSETVWKVIVPAALPGIVGGFLLAISRAIGETMIVLMAAGVAANLTANPLESVTTVTTQIVVLLTGDQSFDSVKTLAAFALGLGLFITTLMLNIIALHIVRKYREQYE